MKKLTLLTALLAFSFLFAKDSELRDKWQDAKKAAKDAYKALQSDASDEKKAEWNISENFDNLFTFDSNFEKSTSLSLIKSVPDLESK